MTILQRLNSILIATVSVVSKQLYKTATSIIGHAMFEHYMYMYDPTLSLI